MAPTISLGSLVFPTAGLIYILGAWIALSAIERGAKKVSLDAEMAYGLAATALAAGFVGARLIFVILHWPAYRENLSGILWPLTNGFDLWGGLLVALAAAFFFGRAKQAPLTRTLDALAPGLIFGLMIISLADFFGGPGYGVETALPWAIDVYGIERHPVQLYEIFFGILALVAWSQGHRLSRIVDGHRFFMSIGVYSAGRLFVDAYRANTPLTDGGYHVVQILSLIILLAALFLLGRQIPASDPGGAAG